jgi:hypothetical protein
MIADRLPPFSPIFLILPFKYFFNNKLPAFPGSFGDIRQIAKVDNPKTAAADVAYRVSPFQIFPLGDTGQNTVKMDRLAGIFVRNGHGNILYRLAAPGALRYGQGAGG